MDGSTDDAVDPLEGRVVPDGENAHSDWRTLQPLDLSPILSAALDAFYETGFHGTSVREIARRVGVTVPALYYHHENKEGLLIALLELSTSDVLSRAHAADAEGAGDDAVQGRETGLIRFGQHGSRACARRDDVRADWYTDIPVPRR